MPQKSLQTSTNISQYFRRLISKTCCSCPLLGPTNSILPQSGNAPA